MTTFCKNLKRLRLARNLTQEQAAEALGVSAQSVSRWECDTTLPDVTMLPQIARLYCATIDDLYKETSVAYDNYAQRMLGVYEVTHQPEDFIRADQEFRKLLKSENYTMKDLRLYGILHQYMMHYCIERTSELFDRVLRKGPEKDPETYWSTRRQKGYFLWEIGRNNENMEEFLPLVEAGSGELQEWICMIQAYQFAQDHETAWKWLQKAMEKFPECAQLHSYSGSICHALKRYEEAFIHWKRARELEPKWLDAAYAMGECYEELGEYAKAYEVWCQIADDLAGWGYDAEVAYPRERARKCREKMTNIVGTDQK